MIHKSHYVSVTFCLLSASLCCTANSGSELAVRSDGRKVVLEEDGTWKFAPPDKLVVQAGGDGSRARPRTATAKARSGFGTFDFAYDPNRWSVEQHPLSDTAEFVFRNMNGSANAKVVTERIATSIDALKALNLDLIRKNDPKGRVVSESALTVNGKSGVVVDATFQAMGATWHSRRFLWTGTEGSIQIICLDAESTFAESARDFDDLIAGFDVVAKQ